MSVLAADTARPLTGITLKILSVCAFVTMSSCIKAAPGVPAGQVVFFRSFFAILPVVVMLAWRHELATALYTTRPFGHITRGLVGVGAMGLGFFALTRLPLPEWIALNYAQPLLVVVFSALILGETVRIFRWSAVIVGFIGVIIVSWPKMTLLTSGAGLGDGEAVGIIAALAGAAISAMAMLQVRRLVQTERTATVVIWFCLTATVAGLATWPFGWVRPDAWQASLLIAAGIFGGVGQILMTESYRHAPLSTIAPFEYTSMLLGIVIGFFVFGEVPTAHVVVGGSIVVVAGLFIIWRENRLGLPRGRARKVTPPQG